jgi:hypothetical protein
MYYALGAIRAPILGLPDFLIRSWFPSPGLGTQFSVSLCRFPVRSSLIVVATHERSVQDVANFVSVVHGHWFPLGFIIAVLFDVVPFPLRISSIVFESRSCSPPFLHFHVQIDFLGGCSCWSECTGIILELLDQKARIFLVLIILTRWFLEHARKVFDEMPMKTWIDVWSDFGCRLALVCILLSFRIDSESLARFRGPLAFQ